MNCEKMLAVEISQSCSNKMGRMFRRASLKRAAVITAAIAGAMLMSQSARADFNWDPTKTSSTSGGGPGTWDTVPADNFWFNGSADVPWPNSTGAIFGGVGTTGTAQALVNLSGAISATGLNFSSNGYLIDNAASASNTLTLTGVNPTITVGNGTAGNSTSAQLGTNADVVNPTTTPVLFPVLSSSTNGFTLTGGGELVLGATLGFTGQTVTVNGGSTLTLGDKTVSSSTAAAQRPYLIMNGNNVNLNNGVLSIAATGSLTGTTAPVAWKIGNIAVAAGSTSSINANRIATGSPTSVSMTMTSSSLTLGAGSNFSVTASGNFTSSATGIGSGSFVHFSGITMAGSENLYVQSKPITNSFETNGATSETLWGTSMSDSGGTVNFTSDGSSTNLGSYYEYQGYSGTANWVLGNAAGTAGAAINMNVLGGNGQMTTGSITVNPFSALAFNGQGANQLWGNSAQTITINGIGNEKADLSAGLTGALYLASTTLSTTAVSNELLSKVVMGSSSIITVAGATTSQIDGNITDGGSGFQLTKGGTGTLILSGTANSWTGGTVITTGSIVTNGGAIGVNGGAGTVSSIGTGPLTLASNSTPSSPELDLNNPTQTIGSLTSSFNSAAAATNTIKLNGTALTIKQTSNTRWGTGGAAGQTSTISDNGSPGSVKLDVSSTGVLTFGGANTYTGGTTVNGGSLLVTNTTNSATGSGAFTLGDGTHPVLLGGSGIITGLVTAASGSTISPGGVASATTGVITHSSGSTLTLSGGLTLNSGSILKFNLDTPTSNSDLITLGGSGLLTVPSAANSITVNLSNLGGMTAGGTYPLITYSSGETPVSLTGFSTGTTPTGLHYSFVGGLVSGLNAVELLVTPPSSKTWAVGSGSWDLTSNNWTPTNFNNGDFVIFGDNNPNGSNITVTVPNATNVQPGSITFSNNTTNYILTTAGSGSLSGITNLTVGGTGKVTLSSATGLSGFTGSVIVNGGGTLSVDSDSELGTNTNPIVLSTPGASLSTLQTTSSFSSARPVTLNAGSSDIDVASGTTLTLSGGITGAGALTKSNSGTLILSAAAAYLGNTNITGGTLQVGANGVFPVGTLTNLTVGSSATFDIKTFSSTVGSITGSGTINTAATLNVNGTTSTIFSGSIAGTGNLTKGGSSTLTLSGSSNMFNNLTINGGTVIGGSGGLGTGTLALSGATSTLRFSSAYSSTQVLSSTTSGASGDGGIIDLNGNAVTLGTLAGTGSPTVIGGSTLTFSGSGGTNTGSHSGVVIGNNSDTGTTVAITAVDALGVSGIGAGTVTVNNGATFWIENTKLGFLSSGTGAPTTVTANQLLGLTFNDGSTWKGTGNAASVSGSPSIADSANVTFTAPAASDKFVIDNAIRSVTNGGAETVSVVGNGTVQLASGAVSAATTINGSWKLGDGVTTPTLVVQVIAGGFGEPLNALGFGGGSSSGPSNPIAISSGTITFGADAHNIAAGTGLVGVNSFRSPMTFTGGALASTGVEYDTGATNTTTGAAFTTTPVSANIAGDIVLSNAVSALTYDPQSAATPNKLNFINSQGVTGNFIWNSTAVLTVNAGSTSGGSLNFGRSTGNVSVNGGSAIAVGSNSTVNVGKWFTPSDGDDDIYAGAGTNTSQFAAGALVTMPNATDPFTDSSVAGDPTNSSTSQSVAATVSGTLNYAARTGVANGDSGIKDYHLSSLTIQTGGKVSMDTAALHTDRSVLITSAVTTNGTGTLNLGGNDMIIPGGAATIATTVNQLKAGFNAAGGAAGYWNGTGGIVSSAARADTRFLTTLGYRTGGSAFDGVNTTSSDLLVKYTYYGDANLDGTVNGADYQQIDMGFGSGATGWFNGDFNYDGVINGSDFALIDNTFNQITATGATSLAIVADSSSLTASPLAVSAVPEPTTLGLLGIGAVGLLGRRRRKLA